VVVDWPRSFCKLSLVNTLRVRRFVTLVGAALVVAAVGCRRDRCVPVCEQRAKELHCASPESCKVTCDKLHNAPSCAAELKAFEACFVKLPLKDWTCDEEHQPVPHAWACPEERNHVVDCMQKAAPPPPAGPPPAAPAH
jgi:hypothetical protein